MEKRLKATELRYGNLLQKDNNIVRVSNIFGLFGLLDIYDFKDDITHSRLPLGVAKILPIPLTEDWLIKLGLTKVGEGKYGYRYALGHLDSNYIVERDWREEPSHFLGIEYTDSPFPKDEGQVYNFSYEIRYVHQLQNLIFHLLGVELKYEI